MVKIHFGFCKTCDSMIHPLDTDIITSKNIIHQHQLSRQHTEAIEFYEGKQICIRKQKEKIQVLRIKLKTLKAELEKLKIGQPYYE